MERATGLLGLLLLLGIAFLLSSHRSRIRWKTVAWGIGLQVVLAVFVLRLSIGRELLAKTVNVVTTLILFADEGSRFVFGWLSADNLPEGSIFAFRVLPIVIFISSFFSCLYYLGVMQLIVGLMARVMKRFMAVSGAESLTAAANVFMGQTEAPLVITPYIASMTESELLAMMTAGMATVSGAVMGGYIALGIQPAYLITASVMSAPASLVMAKLIIPETGEPVTSGRAVVKMERTEANLIEAAAKGAGQGAMLAINIAAMLIAFMSLIYMINAGLAHVSGLWGGKLSLQSLLGHALCPLAFLLGVPWADAPEVGRFMGVKVVLNEFIAYTDLAQLRGALQPKSELIATYTLCGFANFGSIGVQIGGIGVLAPSRRSDLARLGLRALAAAFMASCMTAAIAGIIA
jgi:CNT family concentrative nucleoside transporter